MVLFNHATREMTAKIVYYGPGLCGKTTNLLVIFDKLDPKNRGKMLSLATKTDRTLFFDLLPVDVGKVGAFNLKIQLYTVPGQVFYNETRKLVLKGADSIVFVADSQPSMVESNRESFLNLMDNMKENNLDPNDIPIVIQFNKRDIPGVLPVEQLQERLGFDGYPYVEASAVKGEGVMETFKLVSKITAKHLVTKLQAKPGGPSKESAEDKKKAAKKISIKLPMNEPAEAAAEPAPQPKAEEPAMNPFADSIPFPDSGPEPQNYEKVEEVSLEQLLEGRERPLTFGGNVPLPVLPVEDDVEDVGESEMITPTAAVAVEDEPESVLPSAFPTPPAPAFDASGINDRIAFLEDELRRVSERQEKILQLLEDFADDVRRLVRE
jgi:mutual gliding-motility protein MglA